MKTLNKALLSALSVSALLLATSVSAATPAERGAHKLSESERQIQRDNWFAQVDANNDGYISEAEFVAMATARAEARAKAAFARMDEHNTGEISAADFAAIAEQRSEQFAQRREAMQARMSEVRQRDGEKRGSWREGRRGEGKGVDRERSDADKETRKQRRSRAGSGE